jgi:Asp-tRNA(Asn)/Glu-tRNA(Gln) amidotransferase A subunit family amidase
MADRLLGGIGAAELRACLLGGAVSPREVVQALIDTIGEDPHHAWAHVDPDGLRAQAAALDALTPEDRSARALYGVPVAIKDNFDTADLPTEYGSPIYAGHRPRADAAAVTALRNAGAIIAGKARCAEFAWMTPPETINPIAPGRTPGGSSNGSAAAVAAGTVPLANGTQTAGSVNRPASYCGVLGFKPSLGRLDRAGAKLMSPTLDTVGLFAREVGDLRLAFAALTGAPVRRGAAPPRVAFAPSAAWSAVEPEAATAIEAWLSAARSAGGEFDTLELPGYAELATAQETIQRYESARSLAPELRDHPEQRSQELRSALHDAAAIPSADYERARAQAAAAGPALIASLRGYDAVLTPSATGVPPLGLSFTGDPLFCRVWTIVGAPSLSLPLVWTPDGLPVGLQAVAPPGDDAPLLDVGGWLIDTFGKTVRPTG